MKRTLFSILAVLCLLGACSKEDVAPAAFTGIFDFSLEGTIPDLSDQQTKGFASAVVRMEWATGDEISVINLTSGKHLGGTLVAQASGTTTTFSGLLTGTINSSDELVFVYPSQGWTDEGVFSEAVMDLSDQEGKADIPYFVYATTSLADGNVASASATFQFLTTCIQLNITGLPASDSIDEITIENVGSSMSMVIENGVISTNSTSGTITLSGQTLKTSAKGSASVYVAVAPGNAAASRRKVTVTIDGVPFMEDWSAAAIGAGKFITTVLSQWDLPINQLFGNTYKAENAQSYFSNRGPYTWSIYFGKDETDPGKVWIYDFDPCLCFWGLTSPQYNYVCGNWTMDGEGCIRITIPKMSSLNYHDSGNGETYLCNYNDLNQDVSLKVANDYSSVEILTPWIVRTELGGNYNAMKIVTLYKQ